MSRLLITNERANMKRLNYDGLVEPWKVDLIIARARRMGFRRDELEDVQQELVLDLLNFRYDPGKSNGAKELSVIVQVIDNRLRNLRRSAERYVKRIGLVEPMAEAFYDLDAVDLAIDVRETVAALSHPEQLVCQGLEQGCSKHQVAEQLGWSWHRVNRLVKSIRRSFSEIGLNEWLMA